MVREGCLTDELFCSEIVADNYLTNITKQPTTNNHFLLAFSTMEAQGN